MSLKKILLLFFTTYFVTTAYSQTITEQQKQEVQEALNKRPAVFMQNQGQWADEILFRTQMQNTSVLFLKDRVSFTLTKFEEKEEKSEPKPVLNNASPPEPELPAISYLVWNVSFINSNESSIKPDGYKKTNISFFNGADSNDWVSGANAYEQLTYTNLYNDIDLAYYAKNNNLKYDFIVKPGGKASDIKLGYEGIETLTVNEDGQLVVNTAWGDFIEDAPFAYQIIDGKTKEVKVKYEVVDSTLTYKVLGNYNTNFNLIIDPTYDPEFIWGTYLNPNTSVPQGSSYNWWYQMGIIAVADNHEIYFAAYTNLPINTTPGAYSNYNNFHNVVVGCLSDSAKELKHLTYSGHKNPNDYNIGGNFIPRSIQVSPYGVYVLAHAVHYAGVYVHKGQHPITGGAYRTTPWGGDDYILMRYGLQLDKLEYSTYLGGPGTEYFDIFDGAPSNPATNPAGGYYGWETLKINSKGEAVFAFNTNNKDMQRNRPTSRNYLGKSDVYIIELSTDGRYAKFAGYIGSEESDIVSGIDINKQDEILIIGSTRFSQLYTKGTAFKTSPADLGAQGYKLSHYSGFFMKISPVGSIMYASNFGGKYGDFPNNCRFKENGNIVIVGSTSSANFSTTSSNSSSPNLKSTPISPTNGDTLVYGDCFIIELDPDGNLIQSSFIGGVDKDYITGLGIGSDESIYLHYTQVDDASFNNYDTTVFQNNLNCYYNNHTYWGNYCLYPYFIRLAPNLDSVWFVEDRLQGYNYNNYYGWWGNGNIIIKRKYCQDYIYEFIRSKDSTLETRPWVIGPEPNHNYNNNSYGFNYLMVHQDTIIPRGTFNPGDIDLFCDSVETKMDAGVPNARYLWSTGETTRYITARDSGEYWVKAFYGCDDTLYSDTAYMHVINSPKPVLRNDDPVCDSTSIILTASVDSTTPYTIKWLTKDTSGNYNLTDSFTYSINVDSNNSYMAITESYCGLHSDTSQIRFLTTPVVNLPNDTTHCGPVFKNKRLKVGTPDNEETYQWSVNDTTNEIIVYDQDTYWVKASNFCGEASDTFIMYNQLPPEPLLGADSLYCNLFTRTIHAKNLDKEATYLWSTGDTSENITVADEGDYWVRISNICAEVFDTVTIYNLTTPVANLPDDSTFCEKVNILLDAGNKNNNATYTWIRSGGTLPITDREYTATDSGTYYVIVENVCGKDTSNMPYFDILQKPTAPFLGNDTTYCGNITPNLLYAGNEDNSPIYKWYKDGLLLTVDSVRLVTTSAGIYLVNISNKCLPNGVEDDIYIGRSNYPVIELGRDTNFCGPFILELNGEDIGPGAGNLTYRWLPTLESSEYINVTEAQTYSVKAVNEFGCDATDYITITETCPPFVYVPNSFTPNGDGKNEVFKPSYAYVDEVVFTIYNRWGEKVFETTNLEEGWDGTYRGEKAPAGQYVWILTYRQTNQPNVQSQGRIQESINGNIILVR